MLILDWNKGKNWPKTLKGKMLAKFSSAEFCSYCVLDELPGHLSLVFRFQMNVYFASQGVGLLGSS